MFPVIRMGGHRRRPNSRFAGRVALAALLTAATVGWIGEGDSAAAAPAELISVNPPTGAPLTSTDASPSVSGDGNIVVFTAIPPFSALFVGNVQVAVRNRSANTTTVVPAPFNVDRTTNGVVSRDGCHVAFWGYFTGFFFPPFLTLPAQWWIYTWDRCTADASPVAVSPAGNLLTANSDTVGPLAISADGRYVAYGATKADVGSVIGRVTTSPTVVDSVLSNGAFNPNTIDISDDGAYVAIGAQTTINDLTRNAIVGWTPPCSSAVACNTEVLAAGSTGQGSSEVNTNPSLSADGRYVAFTSNIPPGGAALTSHQVYVLDRGTGTTKLVTSTPGQVMPGDLDDPEITPDGSQVALVQSAARTVNTKPVRQVFVARSASGFFDAAAFDLVSYGVSGAPGSLDSALPSMSSNGRFVAFSSLANNELSGATLPPDLNVWMRERPIALDITPSLDFGTIDLGVQSPPQNAVVTNTSNVAINIGAVSSPAAPFAILTNGCGGLLAPGASCAITVVFTPTVGGSASSSITVSGDGLSVSVSLVGNGKVNIPIPGSLTMTPASHNFGSAVVGTSFPPKRFTVKNPGQTAVPLAGSGLSGPDADEFSVVATTCAGSVGPGATCTIDVAATVTRGGGATATIGVVGTGGQTAQATLRIAGSFAPVLKMNPGVVSAGQVTTAIGSGFPPNIDVQLAFDGEAPFGTVHTDGAGAFRYDYLILRNGVRIGGRQVIAVDQPSFSGVRAPLLIDLATYRPSGFSNSPAITNGVRSLVNRGG